MSRGKTMLRWAISVGAAALLATTSAIAMENKGDEDKEEATLQLNLNGVDAFAASGSAVVVQNSLGPDEVEINIVGGDSEAVYRVYLASDSYAKEQYVASALSDVEGSVRLSLRLEVLDAFYTAAGTKRSLDYLTVFNAAGNRVLYSDKIAVGGAPQPTTCQVDPDASTVYIYNSAIRSAGSLQNVGGCRWTGNVTVLNVTEGAFVYAVKGGSPIFYSNDASALTGYTDYQVAAKNAADPYRTAGTVSITFDGANLTLVQD